LAVALSGTLWYRFVEGWSWSDAVYMTVITLATVGYGETHPLGNRGRLFTISLILMGVISIGYIVNRFTEAVIQGYFQEGIRLRQRRRFVDTLTEHYILCGFGRTGRQIALEFKAEGYPVCDDRLRGRTDRRGYGNGLPGSARGCNAWMTFF
jgi:voltage-gated potassium channel